MKGYLFGLGTMLVGAGLMFVLMLGEVTAQMVKKPSVDGKVEGQVPEGKAPEERVTYGFMFPLDPFIIN